MKNFFPTLLACVLVGGLVYFGLTKFINKQEVGSSSKKSTKVAAKQSDSSNDSEGHDSDEHASSTASTDFETVIADYKTWKTYNKEHIELSFDFLPINEEGDEISKQEFLEELKTGAYIAFKDGEEDGKVVYRLELLPEEADAKIGRTSKSAASSALHYYKMEGSDFPEFNVKDLNGDTFSSADMKDKIYVVKCWFVRCTICVKEFPELNELFDKYEGNDKVEFLSFAFDKEEMLKKFLVKKKFRYPVVAEQQKYVMNEIKAKQFPLHILVKNGKIVKMVNNVEALVHFLEQATKE